MRCCGHGAGQWCEGRQMNSAFHVRKVNHVPSEILGFALARVWRSTGRWLHRVRCAGKGDSGCYVCRHARRLSRLRRNMVMSIIEHAVQHVHDWLKAWAKEESKLCFVDGYRPQNGTGLSVQGLPAYWQVHHVVLRHLEQESARCYRRRKTKPHTSRPCGVPPMACHVAAPQANENSSCSTC